MVSFAVGILFAYAGAWRFLFPGQSGSKPLGFDLVFGLYLAMRGDLHLQRNHIRTEAQFERDVRRYMAIAMLVCFGTGVFDTVT